MGAPARARSRPRERAADRSALGPATRTATRRWRAAAAALLALTAVQLVLGAASGLPQFAGKGFAARLVAYPVLVLALPAVAALRRRSLRRNGASASGPLPWAATTLVAAPFWIDVTGNTLDLYDRIGWWDDANHAVNWFLLCSGAGLVLRGAGVRPRWALGWLVAGLGALLAVGWELAEYAAFIRFGTELAGAYRDTLGDLALGCAGAGVAGWLTSRTPAAPASSPQDAGS